MCRCICKVYGISRKKLTGCIENVSVAIHTVDNQEFQNTKENQIASFLKGLYADGSFTEDDPVDLNVRRISNLCRRKDLYCEAFARGGNSIPDYSYFLEWLENGRSGSTPYPLLSEKKKHFIFQLRNYAELKHFETIQRCFAPLTLE